MLNNHNLELHSPFTIFSFKTCSSMGDLQLYELPNVDYISSLKPPFSSGCV